MSIDRKDKMVNATDKARPRSIVRYLYLYRYCYIRMDLDSLQPSKQLIKSHYSSFLYITLLNKGYSNIMLKYERVKLNINPTIQQATSSQTSKIVSFLKLSRKIKT